MECKEESGPKTENSLRYQELWFGGVGGLVNEIDSSPSVSFFP